MNANESSAPESCHEILPPMSAIQRERYPVLEIERVLSNAIDNLLRREAGTTVRTVGPAHETLVVGRISYPHARTANASPLSQPSGRPRSLEDLRQHSLIGFDRDSFVACADASRNDAQVPRETAASDRRGLPLANREADVGSEVTGGPARRR
jgi:DNA-binding transcriptional LysR family regulator